jgi:signal transduction histidine kinase
MKLVPKMALAFIAGSSLVLTLSGARRLHRDANLFRRDREREILVVGRTMANAASAAWKASGPQAATAMLEDPGTIDPSIRVRWVCLPYGLTPAAPDLACASATSRESASPIESVDAEGKKRRFVYVPVDIPGEGRKGAIEVSDSLEPEASFRAYTILDIIRMNGLVIGALASISALLSALLVGRPTGALIDKARRVGKGDFEGPLKLRGRDELAELAGEMNAMCAQLAQVHERVRSESAARVAAMHQLRHADRLTTVGKLASGIAHELGTPLNVIEARASMIASGEAEGEAARDHAKVVIEASERMTRIIRQLLEFARRRGPEKTRSDIVEVATYATELLRPLAHKRRVTLTIARTELRPFAATDAMQFQQALTNLIVNAVQASEPGSAVEIAFGLERVRPPAGVSASAIVGDRVSQPGPAVEGDYVCIHVIDHGTGIRPDHIEHVFEPFFTTKDIGEGTGLGLSVAYGIVRDHGGWIAVESEIGRGSRFTIYLPRVGEVEEGVVAA